MNNYTSNSTEKRDQDFLNNEIFPLDEMIPGIVHNISNPLTIIKVRTQILQNKIPESPVFPALLENVAKIENILGNLAERINNLHNDEIRPINLKYLVKSEIMYLEADLEFKHKITKKIDLQESQPYIKAVYRHLSEGFLAVVSAFIRMMNSVDGYILQIGITAQVDLIALKITANTTGLSAEEIQFFSQIDQHQDAATVLSARPSASPELQLLIRSFYCFRPYINDFILSSGEGATFECQITFPTGK